MSHQPLKGLKVLEFSQYLSGPSAGLRLADMGARVIKIERPNGGDACRQLAIKNMWSGESSLLFHTINRNKESFAADLKNHDDLLWVKRLIREADVLTHNFRPGVMEKAGLDYEAVKAINPKIIYAEISGYGTEGPWKAKPGQDLLLQALSGLAYTTGNADDNPVPFGIAVADILCGAQAVQGILAALLRREKRGLGALVQISLLESLLDFQFELLTTYYASGKAPQRSAVNNGHSLLGAPYGIYQTADGFLAVAMVPLQKLADALEYEILGLFGQEKAFSGRDEIKSVLANLFKRQTTGYWMAKLTPHDIWAAPVMDWKQMRSHSAYKALQMEQTVGAGKENFVTTRCPVRINGQRLFSARPAPLLGQHTDAIKREIQNTQVDSRNAVATSAHAKTKSLHSVDGRPLKKPLQGLVVVDFSQFLSGPSASLRLADMGARVIKVERKGSGDICRELYVSDVQIEGESTIFHAINRNKESFAVDLKNEDDFLHVVELVKSADVVMHNFRPGVMERLGLDYKSVKAINPSVVYAEISGYGSEGPWRDKPGQDLLLQAVSGLTWLSGSGPETPVPMGVAVVDILAGTHIAQGILAALYGRIRNGEGALVQVSMFESVLDFQFEVLTCFYNDGGCLPERSAVNGAHAYVAAPYGIYKTADGYLALAMANIPQLATLLRCDALQGYTEQKDWFDKRDEIKHVLATHLQTKPTAFWLSALEPADVWCARVLDYDALVGEEAYRVLNMELKVKTAAGLELTTTRCPLRFDGQRLQSAKGAPALGEHNESIAEEFLLQRKAV